jgi:shikimate dehydrogenase
MDIYGLIGYPLGHSFSISYFNEKFQNENINARYVNFEIPNIEDLREVLDSNPDLKGLNVTIPYKQKVIPYLDEVSPEARAIGAVNVIRITRPDSAAFSTDKPSSTQRPVIQNHTDRPVLKELTNRPILKGFNSDIIGFMDSIRPLLQPHHKRALVLGTGGASKAICHGLERLGLEWRYVSRHRSATVLGDSVAVESFTYSDITPALLADYTVIVNCTPLGMYPKVDAAPTIPYAALSPRHLLYDLVYNPEVTQFMREGRRFGATVKSGLEMLHRQAVASWKFWNEQDV